MATALTLESLYRQVDNELEAVRAGVLDHWTEAFRLVYGATATPPKLGGKMMRPALCLLSAGAAGAPDLARFIDMATAMELLHLAALAHDDVVDSALLRRGNTSLNARWDNHTAVLGGDYLVARALTVLTKYDSCAVVASALESIHEMAEGELINFGRGKEKLGEDDCIRLAEKKTASLFAVAASTSTLLTNDLFRRPLHAFGMGLGTAFQLVDDVLDLDGDTDLLGKPLCGDIAEGKTTLPILYMTEGLDTVEQDRLRSMADADMTETDREWVARKVCSTGARDRTLSLARKYVDHAHTALGELPRSSFTEALEDVADFVLIRDA